MCLNCTSITDGRASAAEWKLLFRFAVVLNHTVPQRRLEALPNQ